MIRRIVYATDFSKASRAALVKAIELAKTNRASLHVVHVLAPVVPLVGSDGYMSPTTFEQIDRTYGWTHEWPGFWQNFVEALSRVDHDRELEIAREARRAIPTLLNHLYLEARAVGATRCALLEQLHVGCRHCGGARRSRACGALPRRTQASGHPVILRRFMYKNFDAMKDYAPFLPITVPPG